MTASSSAPTSMALASTRGIAATLVAAALIVCTAHPSPAQIVRAAWLTGCWEARSADRVVEEQWMAPRGRTMLSMGRTVRADTLVDFEQVVLREVGGRLEYEAHPANQPMAVFTSTQITPATLLFENSLHDYPQRVGYTLKSGDSLIAWIDGTTGGKSRRVEFRYGKVRCGT